jgi:hypothetical protein
VAGYGNWEKWVADNLVSVSKRTVENYINLAKKSKDPKYVARLAEAEGLREAYKIIGIIKDKPKDKPSSEVPTDTLFDETRRLHPSCGFQNAGEETEDSMGQCHC